MQGIAITEPTSAYDVLRIACRQIQSDYRCLRMKLWRMRASLLYERIARPRCGTAACEAGWMCEIVGVVTDRGTCLLGFWSDIAEVLFAPGSRGYVELYEGFGSGAHFDAQDGTPEQAELTIAHLRGIMRKYRRELKARIILPGGKVQKEDDSVRRR